jgi:hypothetical protein
MDSQRIGYAVGAVLAAGALVLLAFSTGAIAPLLGDGYDPTVEGDLTDRGAENGTADPDTENGPTAVHSGYEHTSVTVRDAETGEVLGQLEAAIADTFEKRYLGLSATDDLPEDRGMLFVHDSPDRYTYVMRNMSFGIDIVFIDADGRITTIHEAPKPGPNENGNDQTYSGEGRYVLEVNKGWMADRGVEAGDEVVFEL